LVGSEEFYHAKPTERTTDAGIVRAGKFCDRRVYYPDGFLVCFERGYGLPVAGIDVEHVQFTHAGLLGLDVDIEAA
jgi:hypothetical protein